MVDYNIQRSGAGNGKTPPVCTACGVSCLKTILFEGKYGPYCSKHIDRELTEQEDFIVRKFEQDYQRRLNENSSSADDHRTTGAE